jgi:hypothetical protein
MLTSRKVIWELEVVEVKDTEAEALRAEMKVSKDSLPWGQRRKMSSM